jgi:hypothetical protein
VVALVMEIHFFRATAYTTVKNTAIFTVGGGVSGGTTGTYGVKPTANLRLSRCLAVSDSLTAFKVCQPCYAHAKLYTIPGYYRVLLYTK